jgi:hypothetical protein
LGSVYECVLLGLKSQPVIWIVFSLQLRVPLIAGNVSGIMNWRFVLYTLFCDKNSHFLGSPTVRWARGNCVLSFCTPSYIGHDISNASFSPSSGIHSSKIVCPQMM